MSLHRPAPPKSPNPSRQAAFLLALWALAALAAAKGPIQTQGADTPASSTIEAAAPPAVLEIIERLKKRYDSIQSSTGAFTQVLHSESFLENTESEGEFWFSKPDKFRCDFKPPYVSVNLILGDIAYLAVPELRQVERYIFDDSQQSRRHLHQMLLGFGIASEEILEAYEIALIDAEGLAQARQLSPAPLDLPADAAGLRMTPRDPGEAGIHAIHIWFAPGDLRPLALLVDEGEDTRLIRIKSANWQNPEIPESRFDPSACFSPDWEVIDKI